MDKRSTLNVQPSNLQRRWDRPPRTLTLDICGVAAQRTLRCLMFGVGRAHYVGFVFTGKSLPIVFLVPSIFPARFLFFGSSAIDLRSNSAAFSYRPACSAAAP